MSRRLVIGMPGYGRQTASAGRGFWRACADMSQVCNYYQSGSLLASNFNQLWCLALNMVHQGKQVDYFAMLHDDIGPEDFWADKLIDELESQDLDVLAAVSPIKDRRGITSMALHREDDNWMPLSRLSMHDVHQLPETFTSEDIGRPLLVNTGCWVCKFDIEWARQVHFEVNDRIVFNRAADRYQAQTEPEDWFFSRLCHEMNLKVGATRKVALHHRGEMDFTNEHAWGTNTYDCESSPCSPVPGAFPFEVDGWLKPEEGRKLAELSAGKRVLEIGSYCGRSTVCIARTAEHVTAVDYFDGRATPTPRDTYDEFTANIARYGLTDKVLAVHPDDDLPLSEYDLAFIDGAHDSASIEADIDKALAVLSDDGLIVFHDYKQPAHPAVAEAVDNLVCRGASILSVTDSLAVVRPQAAILLEV